MNEIEEQAVNTYAKNMAYLQNEHPQLAKDLVNLDLAIQNNLYQSQYDLEYVNENFDIKDLNTNEYMYFKESSAFANDTAKKINFTKVVGSIEGFHIYDVTKLNIENTNILIEKKDVYTLMKYHVDNIPKTNQMKKIRKFIFIGIGLGLHITEVDKKISATDYLMVEDNLEIFKLSLFTTPYYDIAKHSRLSFSILEDPTTFTKSFDTFLNNNFAYNHYIKYIRVNNHSAEKIRLIQSSIANQNFMIFPYGKRLEMNIKPLSYINSGYKFLNLSQNITNVLFPNKPLLILAAGPSFKKNLEWIKENHEKFIIVAVGAILKTLHANGIRPDIVTHLDNAAKNYTFFDGFNIKTFLKDTIFILSAMVPEKIITIFPKENIYLFENLTNFNNGYKAPLTDCVGSFSLTLSLLLNPSKLYILGLDLALNQETGETHADNHAKNQKLTIIDSNTINTSTNLVDTTLQVEGNTQATVYTNPLLHASIKTLNRLVPQMLLETQTIYNLSDGAKLNGTSAMDINTIAVKDLESIDKHKFSNDLHNMFKPYSSFTLDDSSQVAIRDELQRTLKLRKHIESFELSYSRSNADRYIGDLINLLIKIIEKNDQDIFTLSEVYYDYFNYALGIVEDFFNTQGVTNTKHHIKKFNKMIMTGLYTIQDGYEEALLQFIENKL